MAFLPHHSDEVVVAVCRSSPDLHSHCSSRITAHYRRRHRPRVSRLPSVREKHLVWLGNLAQGYSTIKRCRSDLKRLPAPCSEMRSHLLIVLRHREHHLPSVLRCRLAAAQFLQCLLIAREDVGSRGSFNSKDALLWQWQHVRHRAFPPLLRFGTDEAPHSCQAALRGRTTAD
ncbi:uncharacterized protein B0I36DRAFT_54364 [Microdochium trichocladiopsis]|uniref:Uncharacterized protein n=1 Tax=Microdochium trichocladiopsis TaxID=1682393 RepID=A0A9P8XTL0_9PEZI|nr:uncharacterized protein B0I36DRAFT_54364 [Microdochium trichocladiopsis]KAH7012089.1 hypothetical protein B0I36DRAFT_54364 [Microdochium trichocladiopsis]